MAAKVLVTGASGLLGSHLMTALSRRYAVTGMDRHPWWGDEPQEVVVGDLGDARLIRQIMSAVQPSIIIHCAAVLQLQACEADPAQAFAVNTELAAQVASAAPRDCLVVYMSTDRVFEGGRGFAKEEDAPAPRTVYGRSKLQGEREVAQATDHHLIIRTAFYGWSSGRKTTSGEWFYQTLAGRRPATFFTDTFFTPIYVVDLVERLIPLVEGRARGIVHVGGRNRVSKDEFGRLMAELGRFSMDAIRSGSSGPAMKGGAEVTELSLNSERCVRLTGLEAPTIRDGLIRFLADRGRPLSARFPLSTVGATTRHA